MTHDLLLADRNWARTRGHLAVAIVTSWPMTVVYGRYVAQLGTLTWLGGLVCVEVFVGSRFFYKDHISSRSVICDEKKL